jgi:ferredoxin-NADP reductase
VIAHVILQVQGYGMSRNRSWFEQFWDMVANDLLVGMVTATIGTVLLLVVVVSSVAIVRRQLPYELWYAVHLTAYAGIALAWFHEIPTGNDLGPQITFQSWAPHYWRWLAIVTLATVAYRVLAPIVSTFRHRLRVAEVIPEGPGVTSVRITGRKLDKLKPVPGQFFLWRFLARGHWWSARPFSLSEAPDGQSFRITAKAVGGHTAAIPRIRPGTRVVSEGPFGDFTERSRRRDKVLLVAGGIGITPVRALLERMNGDVVAIYRVINPEDVVFADELAELERERGIALHYVIGDHATPEGSNLLSPEHLHELVPDLAERDVYVCGPPAMTSVTSKRLRAAGVSRRHMHVERFAL